MRIVAAGKALLAPSVKRRLIAEFVSQPRTAKPLARRTQRADRPLRKVLTRVAAGLSNDEIVERLVISPATAKTHVSRIVLKLDARDRTQLVVIAHESGLVKARATPAPSPPRAR